MNRLTRGEIVRWGLALLLAAALLFVVVREIGRSAAERIHDGGVSILTNCLSIEDLKKQIFDTATQSAGRLPTLAYYREHPDELKEALEDVQRTIDRFAPDDCYALPEVRAAGLKPRGRGR